VNTGEYIIVIANKFDKSVIFQQKINEEQKSNIVVYLMENDENPLLPTDKPVKQKAQKQ